MASSTYSGDIWVASLRVTADNQTIVFDENGTTKNVDIPTGRYWCYLQTSVLPSAYPSLYDEITSQLQSAFSGTYLYVQQTPSGADIANLGLQLSSSIDTVSFEFQDSDFTFPPEYLGYAPDRSTAATTSSGTLNSPLSWRGSMFVPRAASDKRSRPDASVARSSDDASRAQYLRWTDDDDPRRVFYEGIYGANIYGLRGRLSASADEAGLPDGDVNNGWNHIWDSLVSGHPAIIAHNIEGNASYSFNSYDPSTATTGYEVVHLQEVGGSVELWQTLDDERNFSSERYDLEVAVEPTGEVDASSRYEH